MTTGRPSGHLRSNRMTTKVTHTAISSPRVSMKPVALPGEAATIPFRETRQRSSSRTGKSARNTMAMFIQTRRIAFSLNCRAPRRMRRWFDDLPYSQGCSWRSDFSCPPAWRTPIGVTGETESTTSRLPVPTSRCVDEIRLTAQTFSGVGCFQSPRYWRASRRLASSSSTTRPFSASHFKLRPSSIDRLARMQHADEM